MGCQGGGKSFDKRNVVLEPESLKAWVAKGGGGKFDKRNVALEPESLKAWVTRRGEKSIIENMCCQKGGKN